MREYDVTITRSKDPMPYAAAFLNMIWIPGGTFRMGSDKHYPEEAPVHRITLDRFWINRTPVTNRQFQHSTLFLSPPRVGSLRVVESVARPP